MTPRATAGRLAALAMLLAIGTAVPTAAAEYTVTVSKLKFGPVPAELHPGDAIIWRNDDILRHTATARDGSFDIDLPAKTAARMVVGAAGTVDVFCRFHPGMTTVLVISP